MENIIESSENIAEPVENVEPQETEQTEQVEQSTESETGEVANSTVEEKPVQSKEENSKFAQIRREAEQKARDKTIAEMGMQWKDKPITTYSEYQSALNEQKAQQEAEQKGIDPEFYTQFKNMEQKLNSIEMEKTLMAQDQQLSNDPKVGSLYKEWKSDVKDIAEQYKVDLDTAFTILTRERIADVMNKQKIQGEQSAIQGLQANAQTTPGSLSSGGQETFFTKAQVDSMSQEEVNKHFKEIMKSQQTKGWYK